MHSNSYNVKVLLQDTFAIVLLKSLHISLIVKNLVMSIQQSVTKRLSFIFYEPFSQLLPSHLKGGEITRDSPNGFITEIEKTGRQLFLILKRHM